MEFPLQMKKAAPSPPCSSKTSEASCSGVDGFVSCPWQPGFPDTNQRDFSKRAKHGFQRGWRWQKNNSQHDDASQVVPFNS